MQKDTTRNTKHLLAQIDNLDLEDGIYSLGAIKSNIGNMQYSLDKFFLDETEIGIKYHLGFISFYVYPLDFGNKNARYVTPKFENIKTELEICQKNLVRLHDFSVFYAQLICNLLAFNYGKDVTQLISEYVGATINLEKLKDVNNSAIELLDLFQSAISESEFRAQSNSILDLFTRLEADIDEMWDEILNFFVCYSSSYEKFSGYSMLKHIRSKCTSNKEMNDSIYKIARFSEMEINIS